MSKKIDDVRVKAGRFIRVENTKRPKFSNASSEYLAIWVEDADGQNERCLLFTQRELINAHKRSTKNPEDIPEKGLLTDLID